MLKKIPDAIANDEEILRGDYHFVDKTRSIRELEAYKIPVFLRRRRFGKSPWYSILECYSDINRKDPFEELVGATDMGRTPTLLRNAYLVMRFDFSKIEVTPHYEGLRTKFYRECKNSIANFVVADAKCLAFAFRFFIEVNRLSGRTDWEAEGRPEGPFKGILYLLEFKHFSVKEGEMFGVTEWTEPWAKDGAQVRHHAEDIAKERPDLTLRPPLVYTVGAKAYRFFRLDRIMGGREKDSFSP